MEVIERKFYSGNKYTHSKWGIQGCDMINSRQVYPYDCKAAAESEMNRIEVSRSVANYDLSGTPEFDIVFSKGKGEC